VKQDAINSQHSTKVKQDAINSQHSTQAVGRQGNGEEVKRLLSHLGDLHMKLYSLRHSKEALAAKRGGQET